MFKIFIVFIGLFLFNIQTFAAYKVSKKITATKTEILNIQPVNDTVSLLPQLSQNKKLILRSTPYYLEEGPNTDNSIIYQEELSENLNTQEKIFLNTQLNKKSLPDDQDLFLAPPEVRTLVSQGPIENRIHLTILGDGYTQNEKEKFFADAERITKNLFTENTFASYLPLFQVHAIFVPSQTSGIGDGSPKNTAFKLYRTPKGSKRAIYPGDDYALERALEYAPKTDYPIVIANDDYYGGLGGRFAISTRSERSGMIVLRHELGHNFGNVGEEYDGGSVYSGANSSGDPKATKWSHWRNDTATYEAKFISGNYIWQNLKNNPYQTTFTVLANHTLGIELSTVGWSSPDDVYVSLNKQRLNLGIYFHNDRNFYVIDNIPTLNGQNKLDIQENIADGDNVIATAFIYAYPEGYNFNKGVTAAFATYSESGRKNFRPTHDGCLMRNMMLKNFCSVDQENMWHQFMNRVNLIDSLEADNESIMLRTPELKDLKISWFDENNRELTYLNENKIIARNAVADISTLKVVVELKTPEVRKYSGRFKTERSIKIK